MEGLDSVEQQQLAQQMQEGQVLSDGQVCDAL